MAENVTTVSGLFIKAHVCTNSNTLFMSTKTTRFLTDSDKGISASPTWTEKDEINVPMALNVFRDGAHMDRSDGASVLT